MNTELYDMVNIGIPCYSSLELPIFDMSLSCALNKGKTINAEREIRHEMVDRVDKIIGNNSLNRYEDYLTKINFYADNTSKSVFDLDEEQRYINMFSSLVSLDRSTTDKISVVQEALRKLQILSEYLKDNRYSKEFYEGFKRDFETLCNGKRYGTDLREYIINQDDS